MLLEALHHKVLLSDDVVLEQRVGLHLRVLDLQLVDFAEEAQDLALLLRAHSPWQQLLQAAGAISELQEPALQQRLQRKTTGARVGLYKTIHCPYLSEKWRDTSPSVCESFSVRP